MAQSEWLHLFWHSWVTPRKRRECRSSMPSRRVPRRFNNSRAHPHNAREHHAFQPVSSPWDVNAGRVAAFALPLVKIASEKLGEIHQGKQSAQQYQGGRRKETQKTTTRPGYEDGRGPPRRDRRANENERKGRAHVYASPSVLPRMATPGNDLPAHNSS